MLLYPAATALRFMLFSPLPEFADNGIRMSFDGLFPIGKHN